MDRNSKNKKNQLIDSTDRDTHFAENEKLKAMLSSLQSEYRIETIKMYIPLDNCTEE